MTNLKKSDRQPPAEKRARARKAKATPEAVAAGAEPGEAAAEKPKKRVTKAKA